jgi:hypothetical protein
LRTLTVSAIGSIHIVFLGAVFTVYCIWGYYFREKRRPGETVVGLAGGMAWMAIGFLRLLDVLQSLWVWEMLFVVPCIAVLLQMLLKEGGRLPSSLAARMLFAAIMGAIAISMAVVYYITVLDVSQLR